MRAKIKNTTLVGLFRKLQFPQQSGGLYFLYGRFHMFRNCKPLFYHPPDSNFIAVLVLTILMSCNPPDSNFIAGLVLLMVFTKSVRCSRFMQIAVISMEWCDSCHPDALCSYNVLRRSARATGILSKPQHNESV